MQSFKMKNFAAIGKTALSRLRRYLLRLCDLLAKFTSKTEEKLNKVHEIGSKIKTNKKEDPYLDYVFSERALRPKIEFFSFL